MYKLYCPDHDYLVYALVKNLILQTRRMFLDDAAMSNN